MYSFNPQFRSQPFLITLSYQSLQISPTFCEKNIYIYFFSTLTSTTKLACLAKHGTVFTRLGIIFLNVVITKWHEFEHSAVNHIFLVNFVIQKTILQKTIKASTEQLSLTVKLIVCQPVFNMVFKFPFDTYAEDFQRQI